VDHRTESGGGMAGQTTAAVAGGVGCALVVVLLLGVLLSYSRLARLRTQAATTWVQFDAQLRRRYGLIPHLVETVRAYLPHERAAADAVVAAYRNALAAAHDTGPAGQAEAERALGQALGRLVSVAEAYADLRANPTFASLVVELTTTEDKIAYVRQAFNDAVRSYNAAVGTFGVSVLAGAGGFRPRESFQIPDDERGSIRTGS
jgi:LemA protein